MKSVRSEFAPAESGVNPRPERLFGPRTFWRACWQHGEPPRQMCRTDTDRTLPCGLEPETNAESHSLAPLIRGIFHLGRDLVKDRTKFGIFTGNPPDRATGVKHGAVIPTAEITADFLKAL